MSAVLNDGTYHKVIQKSNDIQKKQNYDETKRIFKVEEFIDIKESKKSEK